MLKKKVIEEVAEQEVECINPISLASNREGKKPFCVDLSRWVNEHCDARNVRIEIVNDFQKMMKLFTRCM